MLMEPVYKPTLWGGDRLRHEYNKLHAPPRTGESWELSDIALSETLIANGACQGQSLSQLAQRDKNAFWGKRCKEDAFPLLVKLINAEENLSVQVHPSDDSADPSLGERGKAEMWYVLHAEEGACLYLGFRQKLNQEALRKSCEDGSILSRLNRVPVSSGDVFFISPGTVHAIGKGVTLAEIQQSSNTTFRLYDYHRLDANGSPRPLHWERAINVIDYSPLIPDSCKANARVQFPSFTLSELFTCSYFRSFKMQVSTKVDLSCDGSSFHSLLCIDGEGCIIKGQDIYPLCKGQSYFLPAELGIYTLSGSCTVLLSWV